MQTVNYPSCDTPESCGYFAMLSVIQDGKLSFQETRRCRDFREAKDLALEFSDRYDRRVVLENVARDGTCTVEGYTVWGGAYWMFRATSELPDNL